MYIPIDHREAIKKELEWIDDEIVILYFGSTGYIISKIKGKAKVARFESLEEELKLYRELKEMKDELD